MEDSRLEERVVQQTPPTASLPIRTRRHAPGMSTSPLPSFQSSSSSGSIYSSRSMSSTDFWDDKIDNNPKFSGSSPNTPPSLEGGLLGQDGSMTPPSPIPKNISRYKRRPTIPTQVFGSKFTPEHTKFIEGNFAEADSISQSSLGAEESSEQDSKSQPKDETTNNEAQSESAVEFSESHQPSQYLVVDHIEDSKNTSKSKPKASKRRKSSNPPVSNPPVSNPPVSNPPVSNPPVSNPPVSNPPVFTPVFAPFHEKPIDVNHKLHALFGGKGKKVQKKRKPLSSGAQPAEQRYGYIYMYEFENCNGFIKIGVTKREPSERKKEWLGKCKLLILPIEDPNDKPFFHYALVEKIIQIELWEQRRKYKCGKCHKSHKDPPHSITNPDRRKLEKDVSHGEWYEISHETALEVVDKWRQWVAPDKTEKKPVDTPKMSLATVLELALESWYSLAVTTPYVTANIIQPFNKKYSSEPFPHLSERRKLPVMAEAVNAMSCERKVVGALACQYNTYLTELTTTVFSCEKNATKKAPKDEAYEIQLHDTILFPEGGGQPWDHGTLTFKSEDGQAQITPIRKVLRRKLEAIHYSASPIAADTEVGVQLDFSRRFDHAQQHSGQHLLSAVLDHDDISTLAWSMGPEIVYVEVARLPKDLGEIERKCNQYIRNNLPISVTETQVVPDTLPADYDASAGVVRVVSIGGIDANPCCGTHVKSTAELNSLSILYTSTVPNRGTFRIHFVSGNRCQKLLSHVYKNSREIAATLSSGIDEIPQKVVLMQNLLKDTMKREKNLRNELVAIEAEKLTASLKANGKAFLHRNTADFDFLNATLSVLPPLLGNLIVLVSSNEEGGCLIVTGEEVQVKDASAKIKSAIPSIKGGGKPTKFQGKAAKLTPKDIDFLKSLIDE
ncbi:hypothetical protein BP6252_10227 [Coleophoma cylindrospora]|uniref:Threonyl/alanyl tRNA synthetase SAD domain-containing protein n=1 Tax=Coleophoma cylindrospora TaxID=1849047 RepID=A0A3D8QRX2_9HELO|nr:hypothetical protein BP6252_10227 [Coleophoma cylindrospora]